MDIRRALPRCEGRHSIALPHGHMGYCMQCTRIEARKHGEPIENKRRLGRSANICNGITVIKFNLDVERDP